jgi:hypothetical protein
VEGVVAVAGFFLTITFVIYTIVAALVRSKEIGRQAQVMTRLIDTMGGPGGAGAVLESPAGRALFARLIDQRTTVLQRVMVSIQSGVVLGILGIGLFIVRTQVVDDESRFGLLMLAALAITMGIAFLVAAAVSYALSRRWGMLEESRV